jgi:hypothetical protein
VNRQDAFRLNRVLDQKNQVTSLETKLNHQRPGSPAGKHENAERQCRRKGVVATLHAPTRFPGRPAQYLNKEPSDLQSKHAQEQGKLDRMVQEITMDESL